MCVFDINYQVDLRVCFLKLSLLVYPLENLNLPSKLYVSQFKKITSTKFVSILKITISSVQIISHCKQIQLKDHIVSIFCFTYYTILTVPTSLHPNISYPNIQLCLYEILSNIITNRSPKMIWG